MLLVFYFKWLWKHHKTAILSLSQVRWAGLKCFTGCIWPPGRRLPHLDKKIRTEIVSDLLSSQIMSHKVLLQFFVCVVDAQLLQIISVEALKAVHVQNSCRGTRRSNGEHLERNVRRQTAVKMQSHWSAHLWSCSTWICQHICCCWWRSPAIQITCREKVSSDSTRWDTQDIWK